MFDLQKYLLEKQQMIERALDTHLPHKTERPTILHEAMRYSVFAGGKRLRPILCLAAAEAVEGSAATALLPACAIEVLHTYTLIHDDLPAMDNDALRRGKPTCHIAFGEANAILAGDALLTLSFQWMAECHAAKPYLPNQLGLELAAAAGSHGVIAGQAEDVAAEGKEPVAELVEFIHLHKTAALIRAAVRIGAISGEAREADLSALTMYGCDIGLAFQIEDDILNATSTSETLGKAAGSDASRNKMTYVSVHGLKEARDKAEQLVDRAIGELKKVRGNIEPLAAIARFAIERQK
jgi:geranylgeranyl diphosphate synthase, type II